MNGAEIALLVAAVLAFILGLIALVIIIRRLVDSDE